MPLSTDVKLPRDVEPVWPDACVRCGGPNHGHTTKLCTRTIGWWTYLLWIFGRMHSVRVPACERCAWRIQFGRVVAFLIIVAISVAGVALAMWLLSDDGGPAKRWLAMGVALLGIAPFVLWQVFFPPAIDITCYSETIEYEFRDGMYAMAFALLNDGETDDL